MKNIDNKKTCTCQNCYEVLGQWSTDRDFCYDDSSLAVIFDKQGSTDRNFCYDPMKVECLTQELTEDTILMTFQCPGCGCLVQIIV